MSLDALSSFMPVGALNYLSVWGSAFPIHIKVTRPRHSKLGDYRKLKNGKHQITINGNLSPFLFFFVLTHEMAHLIAFEKYHKISPHGKEWKQTFGQLLLESLEVYPQDLQEILKSFAKNPKASFNADVSLARYFKAPPSHQSLIEDLELGDVFYYRSQEYQIHEKRKKRYLCIHLGTGRQYLFSPTAEVQPLKLLNNEHEK